MPNIRAYFGSIVIREIYLVFPTIDIDNAYPMTVATIFGTMWIILSLFGQGGVSTYYARDTRPARRC